MASGSSSSRAGSGGRTFDFGSDDVLCSYDDFDPQDPSNGRRFDPSAKLGQSRSSATMAFPFSKTSVFSRFGSRLQKEDPFHLPRRGYHIDLGAREKALLEEDPALKRFKSYKNTVKRVSKIGDVLTIIVVAACSYEFYAVATLSREQQEQD